MIYKYSSPLNKRDLEVPISCNERYYTDLVGEFKDIACWDNLTYGLLTQNGDVPFVNIINQDNILFSKQIDYENRTKPLIGTHVSYMYGGSEAYYFVGSIHQDSNIETPCVSKVSQSNGNVEYTVCYDIPLIGNYNKDTNKNFIIASFVNNSTSSNMQMMARSSDHGGIVFI